MHARDKEIGKKLKKIKRPTWIALRFFLFRFEIKLLPL